jgi:hypothetical protein
LYFGGRCCPFRIYRETLSLLFSAEVMAEFALLFIKVVQAAKAEAYVKPDYLY